MIAKLRRKMPKFALLVRRDTPAAVNAAEGVVEETYRALLALGHVEADAKKLIDSGIGHRYQVQGYGDADSVDLQRQFGG